MSDSNQPAALPAPVARGRSLAYLIGTYPTLSMIFVLREIVQLRELGFRVETASINPPDRAPEQLTAIEAEEARRTYCVKRHGLGGALKAHLLTIAGNFAGYCRGLGRAWVWAELDLKRLFFNLMYLTEALMVGQWMRRNRLSHLHVHLASQAASVGLFVRHVFGFAYSLTVHGPDEFYDAEGHYLAEKVAAADFVCCISSFARSQLMMLSDYRHWNKFAVVRLGVDTEAFSPAAAVPQGECFEILCIGRLTPAKGQHLLLDAVDRLMRQGRRVRLRLAGGGPDEPSLRKHAAQIEFPECVVFEGAVNQDRVRALYAAAQVFCLPSFAEGIPVVLMEAMAMGIPCVTSQITGIPELIRNGIDGILVPPSDLDALVESLATLMDDAPLRQRLSSNARNVVLERYDLRRNVEKLADIFAEKLPGNLDASR
jgi:colanic acid/amylovoran biosynthesis glycosyltransferase